MLSEQVLKEIEERVLPERKPGQTEQAYYDAIRREHLSDTAFTYRNNSIKALIADLREARERLIANQQMMDFQIKEHVEWRDRALLADARIKELEER